MPRRSTRPPDPPDRGGFPPEPEDGDGNGVGLEEEMAAHNDPRLEHLPDPPQIGGADRTGGLGMMPVEPYAGPGVQPTPSIGRASSPRLFAQAAAFPNCRQLRIWRNRNGIASLLGEIGAEATADDVCFRWPDAALSDATESGIFRLTLRPLDAFGRELAGEVSYDIDGSHLAIQAIRRSRAGVVTGAVPTQLPAQPANEAAIKFMGEALDLARQEINALRTTLETERDGIRKTREDMAQERIDLASNAATGVQTVTERLMENDGKRHEQSMQTLTGIFEQSRRYDEERRVREREEYDRRRKEEREDYERRLKEEEAARLREREDYDRRAKEREQTATQAERERESERQRQHDQRMKEMELSAQREREHAERMIALSKRENDVGALLDKGAKLIGWAGLKPADLIGKLFGSGEGTGLGEAIVTGITKLGEQMSDVAKEHLRLQAARAGMEEGEGDEEEAEESGQGFQPSALPQTPIAGVIGSASVLGAAPTSPVAVAGAVPTPHPADALPLQTQKTARSALRQLITKLKATPDSEWTAAVLGAMSAEPAIYHFVRATSLRRAASEAGADEALAAKIVSMADAMGVPPEIPRG